MKIETPTQINTNQLIRANHIQVIETDMLLTLLRQNHDTLEKCTVMNKMIKIKRVMTVNEIISEIVSASKNIKKNKKEFMKKYSLDLLSKETDPHYTRAIKIAYAILVDGYTLRREWLSPAKMSALIGLPKQEVNSLFNLTEEAYLHKVKIMLAK